MLHNPILLTDLLKFTPVATAVYTGKDLIIAFVNPAMLRIWGKDIDVIGKKYREFVPEIQSQQDYDKVLEVYKTGIPFHDADKKAEVIINGTPQTCHFNYSFTPLFDEQGCIYAVMNTGTDTTELHYCKHQKELYQQSLLLAIESSGLGFYEADLKTKEVKTCGAFSDIWSVENHDLSSLDVVSKIHPDDSNVRIKAYEKAKFSEQLRYEARITEKDQSRWIKVNVRYLYGPEGSPEKVIGLVQDIQTRKDFEQELKNQIRKKVQGLEHSNEDLLQFAHIVSHDLREPIRKIKFFQDLLKKEAGNLFNTDIQKYFDKINYSADRMDNMIEGVLAYSTLNNASKRIKLVNLNAIIEAIKIDLELIIMEKKAEFSTDELPKIEGSAILMQQLFYNLIQNSLKFSKPDNPPHITISSSIIKNNDGEYLQIIITDNGIGLDIAYAERIFKEFERLNSKDNFEGNGLGLALCKKIVQRHNGFIKAAGQIDNGAEFTIMLPLKQKLSTI
ncbi:MAG: PAS domain-containing protein [Chryseobacterium sp.]|nr:MAG: PAS domain-containing protein [Chryseobacterium sp.]